MPNMNYLATTLTKLIIVLFSESDFQVSESRHQLKKQVRTCKYYDHNMRFELT